MVNKTSILLTLIFLVSLLTVLVGNAQSISFSASAQWQVPYVAPGENLVPLQVTLTYNGPYDLYDVIVSPIISPLFSPLVSNTTYEVSKMVPGQQYTFVFLVNVSSNIPLGVYNFYLEVHNESFYYSVISESPITVQVPILGYVNLYAMAQTNGIIFPGESDVPIDITIYDTGTVSATNVILFLNSSYPLNFVTKEIKIPEILTSSPTTVQVLANIYNNATIGSYQIRIPALVFGDYKTTLNMTISVNSNESVHGKILNPTVILGAGPYQNGINYNLQIEYEGPVEVNSYSVLIYLPKGFENTTRGNELVFDGGMLQPGQIITLPLMFNTLNTSLNSYTFPVKIIWNAVEGEGAIVSVIQYTSFSLVLLGNSNIEITPSLTVLYSNNIDNLSLIITNTGSGNIYNVSLSISSPSASIINYQNLISEIKAGQSVSIPLKIYIPNGVSLLQLSVSMNYLNSAYQEQEYTQEIGFYVGSQTQLPILISLSQQVLSPGVFQITKLAVQNELNSTIYNVTITLSSSVIYTNNTFFEISSLSPHSTYYIPIEVFSSQPGSYSILTSINYYDSLVEKSESLSLPIYFAQINSPNVPILIRFSATTLTAGATENTELIIQNTLNISLYNVTISLTPQAEFYVNDTTINLQKLGPLQVVRIPIQTYSSSSGIVSLTSSISYYISGQEREATEIISSLSAGSVDIIITGVSTIPASNIISVTATIYNFGTGSADGLTVIALHPNGLRIIGQNTYYVGNLGPDTSSTFTFAFRLSNFSNNSFKVFHIPIEFVYTNDIGQSLHSYSNLTISITNSSFSQFSFTSKAHNGRGLLLPIIAIIAIIVVILLVVLVRRRGRNE